MTNQQKLSWVTSSFDGFSSTDDFDDKSKRKRQKLQRHGSSSSSSSSSQKKVYDADNITLWADLHYPTIRDDLAVHKKKLQEVEAWLVESIAGMKNRQYLLVTGPSGCGKTAAIQVLAREAGLNIVEWINPTSTPYVQRSENHRWDPSDSVIEPSLSAKFHQFFSQAVKFRSICGKANQDKNIILIEDLPNSILRNSQEFHNILRQHRSSCRNPVVFIVTDSASHQSNVKTLFPPDLQNELSIMNIVFNPIANSYMVKALSRIVSIESYKGLPLPSKDDIQNFAEAASGDIRSAVNALQFACRKDVKHLQDLFSSNKKKSSKSNKGKSRTSKDKTEDSLIIGGKDPTLLLFRALGKVLYCKRNDSEGIIDNLPSHLTKHDRTPLLENPELIYNSGTLPANSFSLFLHQNCTSFFNTIESLASTLDTFTDADIIQSNWDSREKLSEYAASISIRGVMFNTDGTTGRSGWKPLTKPYWYAANNKVNEGIYQIKNIYKNNPQTTKELTTVSMPYLCRIKPHEMTAVEQKICQFKTYSSIQSERLNEMDIDEEDTSDSTISVNIPTNNIEESTVVKCQSEYEDPEEDFIIEEFED